MAALQAARARGLRTIALTGRDGGRVGQAAEIHVNVPDHNTARVQEVHRTLLHVMCELIERTRSSDQLPGGIAGHAKYALVAGHWITDNSMPELRSETMTVNMGPQHPSTHGVLRLVLQLSGETIIGADTTIGYLHTGIEKTAEQKKWQQVIPLVERTDYLAAQSNSLAFILSTERLMGIEIAFRSA